MKTCHSAASPKLCTVLVIWRRQTSRRILQVSRKIHPRTPVGLDDIDYEAGGDIGSAL